MDKIEKQKSKSGSKELEECQRHFWEMSKFHLRLLQAKHILQKSYVLLRQRWRKEVEDTVKFDYDTT